VAPQLIGVTTLFLSFPIPLYQWRLRFRKLFQIEEFREVLAKAREIIEMKFVEKWAAAYRGHNFSSPSPSLSTTGASASYSSSR
jgi:hypothetical protein